MARLAVAGAGFWSTPPGRLAVTQARFWATDARTLAFTGARFYTLGTATVWLGDPQIVDGFTTVEFTAATIDTSAEQPTSWTITQIAGPPVVLSGTGVTRTYVAPAVTPGTTIRWQLVATYPAGPVTATVDHTIRAWTFFQLSATRQLLPVKPDWRTPIVL